MNALSARAAVRFPLFRTVPRLFHLFLGRASEPGEGADGSKVLFPPPFREERVVRIRQVHGTRLVRAKRLGGDRAAGEEEADGTFTDEPGILLRVGVADCLPIFLVDPERPLVALLHAGWRGIAAGFVESALASLKSEGGSPARLLAAIGPSIGPCCYEVGEEVAERLGPGARPRAGRAGRPHVDLFGDARERLLAGGVPEARVAPRPACTACHPSTFHSHRRSGGAPGRNEAFLGIFPVESAGNLFDALEALP